jgi:lipopolysaccharide heptosyltransferase I
MNALLKLQPNRIALIKPSALGDIVHSLPVLSALRTHWPASHITWVINRAYAPLIAGHPDLNAILAFDRRALRLGPVSAALATLQFARQLRQERFDLVIDLQGLLRTGLMAWTTGARHRIGFANARESAARYYTHSVTVPDADDIHAVDRYWRVVETLGMESLPKRFIVPINDGAQLQAAKLIGGLPRPILAIAPGARWPTKRWPVANFAAVGKYIQSNFGGSIVLLGGREDREISRAVLRLLPSSSIDLSGRTSLPVLAAVLDQADVVLANDSGPLHLAAALGRPVVAPYTCTLVRKHGPFGQLHRTSSAAIACHGSYLRTCPHMNCMPTLPPDRIILHVNEILGKWQVRRSA